MGKVGNFFGDLKILLSAARLKSPPDESLDCMAKLVEVQARVRPEVTRTPLRGRTGLLEAS